MASTPQGATLTEQHRRAQLALRALTLRQLMDLWPAFRVEDVKESWPPVLQALVLLVQSRGRDSAALSARYLAAFRRVERVPGAFTPRLPDIPDPDRISRVLNFVGPGQAARDAAIGRPDAAAQALVRVSGSTSRLVLNQGRETLVQSVRADRQALGYARVAGASPCAFCAMLVSRGPVYGAETVGFQAHDHCGCSAEPVFRRDQPPPAGSEKFAEMWSASTEGLSGDEARRAFRRAHEGR